MALISDYKTVISPKSSFRFNLTGREWSEGVVFAGQSKTYDTRTNREAIAAEWSYR